MGDRVFPPRNRSGPSERENRPRLLEPDEEREGSEERCGGDVHSKTEEGRSTVRLCENRHQVPEGRLDEHGRRRVRAEGNHAHLGHKEGGVRLRGHVGLHGDRRHAGDLFSSQTEGVDAMEAIATRAEANEIRKAPRSKAWRQVSGAGVGIGLHRSPPQR